ncbi:hypothetical protein BDR03DRAFT_950967 [Suillus americanus]|nr:hypothetical protein BDR03DRAFT_950967 [Suillus americanus]
MKNHMLYFVSFLVVSCCRLISFLSPTNLFVFQFFIDLCMPPRFIIFYRTNLPRVLRCTRDFFKSSRSCRCLYWGHT